MRLFLLCLFLVAGAHGGAALDPGKFLDKFKPASLGSIDRDGTYRLSAEEKGYDCSDLTGYIELRVLDMRDHKRRPPPDFLTRMWRQLASFFAANPANADPDVRYAVDRARLIAYNKRLGEKGCRTFDLRAELRESGSG